jgi:hypothetical protein
MIMGVATKNVYGPEGTGRTARIFNALGGKVEYGRNAFMPGPPPTSSVGRRPLRGGPVAPGLGGRSFPTSIP